jgi:maltose/moltooligosaccharide transporter
MGIFNMFIVIPMIIQILTLPLYYRAWLGGHPENVIRLAGALLLCAAAAMLLVKVKAARSRQAEEAEEKSGEELAAAAGAAAKS